MIIEIPPIGSDRQINLKRLLDEEERRSYSNYNSGYSRYYGIYEDDSRNRVDLRAFDRMLDDILEDDTDDLCDQCENEKKHIFFADAWLCKSCWEELSEEDKEQHLKQAELVEQREDLVACCRCSLYTPVEQVMYVKARPYCEDCFDRYMTI